MLVCISGRSAALIAKGTGVNSMEVGAVTPEGVVEALLRGPGAVRIRGLFSAAQGAEARRGVMAHSQDRAQTVTHFQGQAAEGPRPHPPPPVWKLLAKGDVVSESAEQTA